MFGETHGWIVGESFATGPVVLRYQDNEWQPMSLPNGYQPYAVHVVDVDEAWLTDRNIGILHYQAGLWQEYSIPVWQQAGGDILMLNEQEGWAVGDRVLHYTTETLRH